MSAEAPHFSGQAARAQALQGGVRAVVLHPDVKSAGPSDQAAGRDPQAALAEAVGLAAAIDLDIVDSRVLGLSRIRPATYIGQGAVDALAGLIAEHEVKVVIVNVALAPVQQRNLERALKAKVIDRTGLILEIFGARARTREGVLQVELAHLSYQQSRLVRSWTHLERQRGGYGFLGGPGESQIETDRRLLRDRIARLRKELAQVRRTRGLHRQRRKDAPYPVVALVGYTNAGKSTLFNRVTAANVLAKDMLFATLDPTIRQLPLQSGQTVLLSDTVGFLSDLPTSLIAAFQATLEEVCQADLILHIRDGAHPDSEAQRADVLAVLAELGIGADIGQGPPILEVVNKIDMMAAPERVAWQSRADRSDDIVAVSALTGEGLDALFKRIDAMLFQDAQVLNLKLRPEEGAALAWLYRHGKVLGRRQDAKAVYLKVRLDEQSLARWRQERRDQAATIAT